MASKLGQIRRRRQAGALAIALLLASVGCGQAGSTGVAEGGAQSAAVSETPETARHFRWKLITTWPKNLPGLGTAVERFAENVRLMSNGRLDITVYGAGELVGAFEVFDAVSQGTAEMGNGASYYWRGKLPVAAVFSTIPFGMTAQEMNGWMRFGGGIELWRELYAPFGLVPLLAGSSGPQMGGWFNKEIESVADLKGLKMRIPGLGGEVLARVGGVPVVLPGSEVFTALQTGVIDATEWVGPYNDLTLGLHTAARFYYYPGWHEPGAAIETLINAKAWATLPKDLQVMVETAAQASSDDMLSEFTMRNAQALQTLVKEHHVQLRAFPADVLAALKVASETVVRESAAGDPLSERILASQREHQRVLEAYHDITERAYMNARAGEGTDAR